MLNDTPSEDLKAIDYTLYQHGCTVLNEPTSEARFLEGYQAGKYQFSQSPHLLDALLSIYQINVQTLCGEWLASTENASQFGNTPIESVLGLIKKLPPPLSKS